MLPVTRIPAVLVLSLFSLVRIHAKHTTMQSSVPGQSDSNMPYKYINKLSLKDNHRLAIQEIIEDASVQREKLLAEYQVEKYKHLSIDEKISEAQVLLLTNLPATAALLEDTLHIPEVTTEQQVKCYRLKYQVYMSLGPLSKGLEAAEHEYEAAKSIPLEAGDLPFSSLTTNEGASGINSGPSDPSLKETHFQAALDLGNAHRFLGNLQEAKTYLDEAERLAVEMGDMDKITMATIHHGDWILGSGHLKEAIAKVFQPLSKRNMSDKNRGLMLQSFGNACRAAADWGPAKEYMREAIAIAERLEDPIAVADRHGDLGTIFRSEGRFADALIHQKKQFVFAKQRGDQAALVVACFNIGFTHFSLNPPDYDVALIYHAIHLELSDRIGYLGMKSRALNSLGKIYTALKDNEAAIMLLVECLEVHSQTGNHRGLGIAYGNIGTVYRAMGKFDEAIDYHEKYLENARDRDDVGGVAIMQRELAMDYLFLGDLETAERQITSAFVTLERIRAKIGAEDTSRIANFEKNQAEAFNLLQSILVRRGKFDAAFALSEQGRARALADLIQRNQDLDELETKSNADDNAKFVSTATMLEDTFIERELSEITQTLTELDTTLVTYSVVTEFTPFGDIEKWLYSWVVAMGMPGSTNGEGGSMNGESDSTNEGRATMKTKSGWEIHFAKRMLSSEKKSKEEFVVDRHVNALCRSLGELSVKETNMDEGMDDCESTDRAECTEASRGHAEDPSLSRDIPHQFSKPGKVVGQVYGGPKEPKRPVTDPRLQRALDKLRADYDIFVAPIETYLPEWREGIADIPKVTFIPQDFMFNLPFCALLGPDHRHLIEKYIISIVPSVKILKLTNQRLSKLRPTSVVAPPSVLAVGNPIMPHHRIPALPAATVEAQMVKTFFQTPGSNGGAEPVVLTGKDATVDQVRREMSKHTVLHFATHAEQDNGLVKMIKEGADCLRPEKIPTGDFSMRGFLVLARSHENCSGLMMAEDIKGQELKAEVAVLSCCQTGKGQVTGDGVVGLYRAFLVAGAASVVVTQWRINDKATAMFMDFFYQDFMVHRDPARALRQAMLSMLRDGTHYKPQHWAAFSLIGASRPIRTA